jgi:hypothetical protein
LSIVEDCHKNGTDPPPPRPILEGYGKLGAGYNSR